MRLTSPVLFLRKRSSEPHAQRWGQSQVARNGEKATRPIDAARLDVAFLGLGYLQKKISTEKPRTQTEKSFHEIHI